MQNRIPPEVLYVIIAAAGGISKYLNEYLGGGTAFRFSMMISHIIVSGFSGFIFALVAEHMNFSPRLVYVCAGVGGFMGAATIDYIRYFLSSRFSPPKL